MDAGDIHQVHVVALDDARLSGRVEECQAQQREDELDSEAQAVEPAQEHGAGQQSCLLARDGKGVEGENGLQRRVFVLIPVMP